MRVFVLEYVTGGGLRGEALPASLAAEAALIRDAMLRDLADLPSAPEVVTTCDERLPLPGAHRVAPSTDAWALWRRLAASAHVVWPVAPETGGILADLVRMLAATGARVLASTPDAIAIAASKSETARRLARAGIRHVPTYRLADAPAIAGACVTKPDDGAGCEGARLWRAGAPVAPEPADDLILQPWIEGEAASLTVLAGEGKARLLAANRQHVEVRDGHIVLAGLTVGALADGDARLAALATAVARALPGLSGIFGIDLILTADGPVVVEVNPRLTTAYAGLRAALGINPATLLAPFATPAPPLPAPAGRPVGLAFA